jgi:hypothetical protein
MRKEIFELTPIGKKEGKEVIQKLSPELREFFKKVVEKYLIEEEKKDERIEF